MAETPFPNPQTSVFNPSAWNIEGLTEDEEAYLDANFVRFPNAQSGVIFPDAPTAPTLPNGTNTAEVATTGFVQNTIAVFLNTINNWTALQIFNAGRTSNTINPTTPSGTLNIGNAAANTNVTTSDIHREERISQTLFFLFFYL